MRICLLSARFPPQRCGVGDYTYFLAGALGSLGHEVHVLTAAGEGDSPLYPLHHRVTLHRLVSSWSAGGLPHLVSSIKRIDPQVLVIQYSPHSFDRRGLTTSINILPAVLRWAGSPFVIANFHELCIPYDGTLKHNLGSLWQRFAGLLLASSSDSVGATVEAWQRPLREMGIRKPIDVIPVGSNIPEVRISEEERSILRKEILHGPEGVLVVGFGAWHDRDIPAVLGAVGQLKRRGRVKLVWIGGGPATHGRHGSPFERVMNENGLDDLDVFWSGVLPHPQVSRLLAIGDLMILPFTDGVSTRRTSAITALQHGIPLLTTRGADPQPWFVHGVNTYLVSAGDKRALGIGCVELVRQPDLRARLARGARELYETHFAWHVIAERVLSSVPHNLYAC